MTLPEPFLRILVAEIEGPDIAGIILGGSHARGDAAPYSDVDLAPFLVPGAEPRQKQMVMREGRLVSVSYKTVESVRADITRPERAIWLVRGFAGGKVLLDKDGSMAALLQDLAAFTWEPLQPAANRFAAHELTLAAEGAYKVLNALQREEPMALQYATSSLVFSLAFIVAVARGVLIVSDRTYYAQVQQAAGPIWAAYHSMAVGLTQFDPPPGIDVPHHAVKMRARAVLHLYRETFDLVRAALNPAQLEVALGVVKHTGTRTDTPPGPDTE
jgi:predicted nucleotidyltransferase